MLVLDSDFTDYPCKGAKMRDRCNIRDLLILDFPFIATEEPSAVDGQTLVNTNRLNERNAADIVLCLIRNPKLRHKI